MDCPIEFRHDFWSLPPPEFVELTCMMPNGISLFLKTPYNSTLAQIKDDLWYKASKSPMYGKLHDMSLYMFTCINSLAEREHLHDEQRRICDIRPVCAVLVIELVNSNSIDSKLNVQISHLIGKRLQEFDDLNNPEVNDFRFKMRQLADDATQKRTTFTWMDRLSYQFPPRLVKENDRSLVSFNKKSLNVMSKFENSDTSFMFNIAINATPVKLLELILAKKANFLNVRPEKTYNYALKVCGRDEYLVGKHTLIEFQYIQDCIQQDVTPVLITTHVENVPVMMENVYEYLDNFTKKPKNKYSARSLRRKENHKSSWHIEDPFTVTLFSATKMNFITRKTNEDAMLLQLSFKVGLFHGAQAMCEPLIVVKSLFDDQTELKINERLVFDIKLCDVPRCAKLCCSIVEVQRTRINRSKKPKDLQCGPSSNRLGSYSSTSSNAYSSMFGSSSNLSDELDIENYPDVDAVNTDDLDQATSTTTSATSIFYSWNVPSTSSMSLRDRDGSGTKDGNAKGTKDKELNVTPIAWANTSVYDFKDELKSIPMTLYMWTFADDMVVPDGFLHVLGPVVSNPNTKYTAALTLRIGDYNHDDHIFFPPSEELVEYAKNCKVVRKAISDERLADIQRCVSVISLTDVGFEADEQDRKDVLQLRPYWRRETPELLPKLLSFLDWSDKRVFSEVTAMLQDWPAVPVENALELLDYGHADKEVRSFAVRCLASLSDDDVLLYLLQLVQAIKHELYLDCDLVRFLLQRAFHNQNIGHFLFWHMRSEMPSAMGWVRFGLIIEAYCRGSPDHIPILAKQLDLIDKLKHCSELVAGKARDKGKMIMRNFMQEKHVTEVVSQTRSPLDPCYRFAKVKAERCSVMDSKMRPLWLAFGNSDRHGDDIDIIFKKGDDLRQDMLTLQMLRIMDRLWKSEGLDMRMNLYNCIALDPRLGLIQVVMHSETLANIQKERDPFAPTSAFRKGTILAWLKETNTSEESLNHAIEEFTLSCAGYCVATYVFGIADRHSDNIMVTRSGRLFHIDFSHILGHFKEKFGIKRERVPFAVTYDFVNVINKGLKTTEQFFTFREYCLRAFLILRRHSNLLLSLCAMMLSTGLPELSSEKDLNYLKETLVLNKSEEEALTHFSAKFDEALTNSWKTCLNWASHNMVKNNKP